MRDIRKGSHKNIPGKRFNPKPPFPEDLPPDVKELYEKYANHEAENDHDEEMEPEVEDVEEAVEDEMEPEMPPALPPNVPQSVAKATADKPKESLPKPRFTGSKVPIANVHVSRQDLSHRAKRVTRRKNGTVDEVPVHKAAPEVVPSHTKEKRPLFAKVAKKDGQATKPVKQKKQAMRLGHRDRKLVALLMLVVLVAAGLAAMLFLPRASLTLTLATAPLLIDHEFTVRGGGLVDPGSVPGQVISKEVQVEGSSAVATTKVIGEKAEGVVRIINRTFDEQSIKEESRLVTDDGTLYFMQRHVTVPAAEGSTLGVATVPVVADVAGPEGNLESGRLNFAALDASAQTVVYAEVAQPITGGSGDEVTVVEESDLEAAREEANRLALQQLEAGAQLPDGYVLLEESREGENTAFETSVEIGDEVETIPFTATVSARMIAYEEAALEGALRAALEGQLNDDYMLFPAPLSFTKSVNEVNWEKQEANVTARVTHTTIPTFSVDTLRDKLAGRSESEAVEYLKGLPGVTGVDIELWPFWVQNIPRIEQRVAIELEPDRQP